MTHFVVVEVVRFDGDSHHTRFIRGVYDKLLDAQVRLRECTVDQRDNGHDTGYIDIWDGASNSGNVYLNDGLLGA